MFDTASAATTDEKPQEKSEEMTDDALAKVQWLKDNMEPTTKVQEYMSFTSKYMGEWVKDKERSVAEILKEFPRLLDIGMVIYYNIVNSFQIVLSHFHS